MKFDYYRYDFIMKLVRIAENLSRLIAGIIHIFKDLGLDTNHKPNKNMFRNRKSIDRIGTM